MTLVGVNFPPSAYVEKANTTQLPFLKIHFLFQCEEGLLCFAEHLGFHYRLIGVRPTAQTVYTYYRYSYNRSS